MSVPPSDNLRFFLRTATAAAHEELDVRFSALDLSKLADYRIFLAASTNALLPLEALLEKSGIASLFADWPARTRTAELLTDCCRLGIAVEPLELQRAPLSRSAMTGVAYVLEGSRLGGKLLLKRVQASKEPTVQTTQAYLSHGITQKLWQSFLVQLEAFSGIKKMEAVEGSLYAFSVFSAAAETNLPPNLAACA